MLDKTKPKIKTKLILKHPIQSPPSSDDSIFNTGTTKICLMKNTPLINSTPSFQLTNGTVSKSTHEGNLQLATLPKEATKARVLPHITSGALIFVAQICDHKCIATFTNVYIIIYNKQMEPQIKLPRDSSTGLWKIDIIKEARFRLTNIQQLKFNISPSITPVPTSKQRGNIVIICNTKLQLAKLYHKSAFSPYISTFVKVIGDGHFATWPNFTANLIQTFLPKITATIKFHLYQVYHNIQSTKNSNRL